MADALSRIHELNSMQETNVAVDKEAIIDKYHRFGHYALDQVRARLHSHGFHFAHMDSTIKNAIDACLALTPSISN